MHKGIIFNLDGTLISSAIDVAMVAELGADRTIDCLSEIAGIVEEFG